MKFLPLFEGKHTKVLRLAKEAIMRDDWHEAFKITEEGLCYRKKNRHGNGEAWADIVALHRQITEKIWRMDIDFSFHPQKEQENEMMTAIIRNCIASRKAKKDWIFFLGISRTGNEKYEDVCMDILAKLADIPWTVCPLSKAIEGVNGICDSDSKNPGTTIKLSIIGWCNESTVKIKLISVTGTSGHGYLATIKKTDGNWNVEQELSGWASW
jgi:hypothetical protein